MGLVAMMHRLSCSETRGIFPYKRLTLSPALARGFLPTLPPGKSLKLKIKVAQSCLTLCDLTDYSLPGSFVYGILQARILGWVAIPFSRGSSQSRNRTSVSCIAGRFFTSSATRETEKVARFLLYLVSECLPEVSKCS